MHGHRMASGSRCPGFQSASCSVRRIFRPAGRKFRPWMQWLGNPSRRKKTTNRAEVSKTDHSSFVIFRVLFRERLKNRENLSGPKGVPGRDSGTGGLGS